MRQGPHTKRPRGRSNGRRGNNNRYQIFDSNGPDGRVRGNASQVYEKYLSLARDAASSGDRIMSENFFQHAEHYLRVHNSFNDPDYDESGEEVMTRGGAGTMPASSGLLPPGQGAPGQGAPGQGAPGSLGADAMASGSPTAPGAMVEQPSGPYAGPSGQPTAPGGQPMHGGGGGGGGPSTPRRRGNGRFGRTSGRGRPPQQNTGAPPAPAPGTEPQPDLLEPMPSGRTRGSPGGHSAAGTSAKRGAENRVQNTASQNNPPAVQPGTPQPALPDNDFPVDPSP